MNREASAVTCIVLNWNGWRDTLCCLTSLYRSEYPNLTVLVVDNGSTDDSVEQIKRVLPQQEILENGANLGFGAGNNRGISLALARGAEYVWLLNNDTVVEPKTLSSLVEFAKQNVECGQIGSVLYYESEPSRVQAWGGGSVNLWTGAVRHFYGPVPVEQVQYITAASTLLRTQTLQQVGLFDENYFMYFEDTDLSFRIRKAGWQIRVCDEARVLHKEGVSSGKKSARFDGMVTESAIQFLWRYAPAPVIPIFVFTFVRAARRVVQGRFSSAVAVLAAWHISRRTDQLSRAS